MKSAVVDDTPLAARLLTAGTAACIADFATFPLDTAKVRLQVQGEAHSLMLVQSMEARYHGMLGTLSTIARQEGIKSLYNGLSAGLQRQMCFASVRIGLYDSVKSFYQSLLNDGNSSEQAYFGVRVAAGISTGGLAVLVAQPTDVVKVRLQAQRGSGRYSSTLQAYRAIATQEGTRGLWRGILPNVGRNAIVNVSEIVCYDVIKDAILYRGLMEDNVPCHFAAAVVAGLCTTLVASPIDVVKTRYMNSPLGEYRGAIDCSVRMLLKEGPSAFYKGFTPSFYRLVSWNIAMWITYEQLKRLVVKVRKSRD